MKLRLVRREGKDSREALASVLGRREDRAARSGGHGAQNHQVPARQAEVRFTWPGPAPWPTFGPSDLFLLSLLPSEKGSAPTSLTWSPLCPSSEGPITPLVRPAAVLSPVAPPTPPLLPAPTFFGAAPISRMTPCPLQPLPLDPRPPHRSLLECSSELTPDPSPLNPAPLLCP